MIRLGYTYEDKITGFTGVCTGVCEYLTGCNQALLVPRVKENGEQTAGGWFDVQRLRETGATPLVLDNGETPGFDMPAPIR